jgi:hypothetical protein
MRDQVGGSSIRGGLWASIRIVLSFQDLREVLAFWIRIAVGIIANRKFHGEYQLRTRPSYNPPRKLSM